MAEYRVNISINLRIAGDVYIDADNEAEARLGIQTLIDNGIYTVECNVLEAGEESFNWEVEDTDITITEVEEMEDDLSP